MFLFLSKIDLSPAYFTLCHSLSFKEHFFLNEIGAVSDPNSETTSLGDLNLKKIINVSTP